MKSIKTKIKDMCILEPTVFGDERGYFFESYTNGYLTISLETSIISQDNGSRSSSTQASRT
ncbi:MAG: dTDP-4-dehydrorhamnose 3,5-epimerase family protein [Euryarchaeota archaeon]|nr:dTDP-4-dehydrorhamnose 3,5-epimerase family protein [Euryarchaeota archaeon]